MASKELTLKKIEESIGDFFIRNHQADVIEATIDTTVDPDSEKRGMTPFLNLWAWEIESKSELAGAMEKAKEQDNPCFSKCN